MKYRITSGTASAIIEGNPMPEMDRLFRLTKIPPTCARIDTESLSTEPADEPVTAREATPTAPGPKCPGCGGKYGIHAQGCLNDPEQNSVQTSVSRGEGHVDAVGQLRSTLDAQAAADSGFSLKQPLYTRGTRVVELGVENARTSRLEHDALPLAKDAHQDLARQVRDENRKDFTVRASNLFLRTDGQLTTREKPNQGVPLSRRSFPQLVGRLDIPSGGAYLSNCPPELRAVNVNHWIDERLREEQLAPGGSPAKELQLRMRGPKGAREIFAITGPRYASYDADMIAEAVARACPTGARGTVAYDGYRAHGEVLFHTTVQPEHFVAGEVFRAGVSWSTDDTGGGSIVCRAMLVANLCLNLIIIDESEQETVRLRHQGNVEKLATGFKSGFDSALKKIEHFIQAWDEACEDNIVSSAQLLDASEIPTIRELLIANAIRGLMDQELVTIPGRRENIVQGVVNSWRADTSGAAQTLDGVNRATVANALTRYAHESGDLDPWEQDVLQAQAGQLVYGAGRYARIPVLGQKGA